MPGPHHGIGPPDNQLPDEHGAALLHHQGAGVGYTGVRGQNTSLATVVGPGSTPVLVAQRLRTGSRGS